MTFPAADLRLGNRTVCLLAKCCDLHAPLKDSAQGPRHRPVQFQKLASIGLQDRRNGAGTAKIGRPLLAGCLKQTAFFHVAAAEIVAIEIFTFFASGSFHGLSDTRRCEPVLWAKQSPVNVKERDCFVMAYSATPRNAVPKKKRATVSTQATRSILPTVVCKADYARVTYSPVRVSTRITSPTLTNCGH